MYVRATQEGNALAGRRDGGRGEPVARSGGISFGRGGWFRPGATNPSVGARPRVRRSFEVCIKRAPMYRRRLGGDVLKLVLLVFGPSHTCILFAGGLPRLGSDCRDAWLL